MKKNNSTPVAEITRGALIAATYVVMTGFCAIFGLDKGVIQFRISEALVILAVFTPSATAGVTVGCLLSNLLFGGAVYDVLFGTLATLLGMLGGRALRRFPYLVPLPTVLSNTAIVPLVLRFAYGSEDALWFMAATVGIGELVCAYAGGILLFFMLRKRFKTYV